MLNVSDEECGPLLQILWNESITGLALVSEDGTFRQANPSFCRLVERTQSELRKLRFQDITAPQDIQTDEEMARLVAEGKETGYEMVKSYVLKTRRIQDVLLRVTGLRIEGKFCFFVGEVAALDSPPAERAAAEAVRATIKRRLLWRAVRENWHVWAAVLGGAGVIAGQAIQYLHPAK